MTITLFQRYQQSKVDFPDKYARDLAQIIGISEAELAHSRVGHDARRLRGDARGLLAGLSQVGVTKSITRNRYAVHEQMGQYLNQQLTGHAGLILNPGALDLRLFLGQWTTAFTLTENTPHGERHSIQFFDGQGDALHKVYATADTDMQAWRGLVEDFLSPDNPDLIIQPVESRAKTQISDVVTKDRVIEAEWRAMTDVHQFFHLLSRHQLTRQQAFARVADDLAVKVANSALRMILKQANTAGNEIMIFVGNRGCVQIFTGIIEKVVPMKQWLNVFNPAFTLHLVEDAIAESWVTRKPTKDGFVTSLELFASDGTQIAQLFGKRSEGQPEQTQWREQIAHLPTLRMQPA